MKREHYFRNFNEAPALLTLEETAQLMRSSYEAMKTRANKGTLPGAFKSGKSWRVDKEVLIASFGTRKQQPAENKTEDLESAMRNLERAICELTIALTENKN